MRRRLAPIAAALFAPAGMAGAAPPSAVIAPPAPAVQGVSVVLDASGSSDPDGGPLQASWELGDGARAEGLRVRHRFASAGPVTVTVAIRDPQGEVATASLTLDVAPAGPSGLRLSGRPPAVRDPAVGLELRPPPGAARMLVVNDPDPFTSTVARPLSRRLPWRLAPGPDGPRVVRVRFLDAEGLPLDGADAAAGTRLDRSAPPVRRVRMRQSEPVLVCRPGGPGVAGTSRSAIDVDVTPLIGRDPAGRAHVEIRWAGASRAPWRPAPGTRRLRLVPGEVVRVRSRDPLGNMSRWRTARVPAPGVRLVDPGALPFTAGLACPGPSPSERLARVRRMWAASGRTAPDRGKVFPPGSHLAWTAYSGQGIHPNWVHAGTELNERLRSGRLVSYRRAVAELLAFSGTDRAPGGELFRVNENTFTTPDDGRPPPWRDAMGTAVSLALLAPALDPAAPAPERALARRAAAGYLATFSVPWSEGGVVWRDGGPGDWYLEYAYRTRARVLNGFMQAVVSLTRFAGQAERLAARDRAWAPLARRARERARAGARAIVRWLPAYDLGGGRTRYALGGGPATPEYRRYHQELLRLLARVRWFDPGWRAVFADYRARWGGSAGPNPPVPDD